MTNVALLVCAALAGWPMFRGAPALTGNAPGNLPDKLELRWSYNTGAPVKSSPAIAAGKVFIGNDAGNLFALDIKTGKPLWTFKAGDSIEATPLLVANAVYTGSADGNLYALDINTGKSNWVYKTEDKILGSANWFGDPCRIVVGSYDFKMHCVDAATGQPVWTYPTGNYINGAPAVADGKIVFGGCDGKLHILGTTGKSLADIDAGAYIPGSPAIADNHAYVGHYGNEVLCVDLGTDTIVWRAKEKNAPFFSSPAVTANCVLIGARDKHLHCYDRVTGQTCWTFTAQGDVDSAPVICGDKVVFGSDDGRLYLVRLDTGKLVWSYEVGKPLNASPAIADGLVVIAGDDGTVYAFGVKVPR